MSYRIRSSLGWCLFGLIALSACSSSTSVTPTPVSNPAVIPTATPVPTAGEEITENKAAILEVKASGEPGDYRFAVTVSSPDAGCSQYADWWEVISLEGALIYRRVLLHSHVDEQPFTRSGGPVKINRDEVVIIRAHMHPDGYSSQAMKGSPIQGFERVELEPDFAADLAEKSPLPESCAF
jgi:hypothetical protein